MSLVRHADALTFEWSLAEQRVVVSSGTGSMASAALRQRGRPLTTRWKSMVRIRRRCGRVQGGAAYQRNVKIDTSGELDGERGA